MLLRDDSTYGYVLRRELRARGIDVEPGTVYRGLRELERDELISSRWLEPAAGPRARVYTITAKGRSHLDRLAAGIELSRVAQTTFLDAYAGPPSPAAT